jgi:hypothetical protein
MLRAIVFLVFLSHFTGSSALAQDCPAGQYRQDLLFGGWTCLPEIGGDVGGAAESVKPYVPLVIPQASGAWQCIQNLSGCDLRSMPGLLPVDYYNIAAQCLQQGLNCPEQLIKGLPAYAVRPAIVSYMNFLYRQADGRWQHLPPEFIHDFQPNYPEINLQNITYATNINTIHGMNMTILNNIYFRADLDFSSRSDRQLVLHELQHSVQYARKGSLEAFLTEYAGQAAVEVMTGKGFNIHDSIQLESDAISKANSVSNDYGWTFKINVECVKPLNLVIQYQSVDGQIWAFSGWHQFNTIGSSVLTNSGGYVHSSNGYWYFYAEATDGSWRWSGDFSNQYGDRTLGFIQVYQQYPGDSFSQTLTCTN